MDSNSMTTGKMTPNDVEYIGGLGAGAFGEVLLVRLAEKTPWRSWSSELLALKQQEKMAGCEDLQVKEVAIYRDLGGCPFVSQLLASFQTSTRLYILTDFYSGGSLQHHIEKKPKFNGRQVAVLAAELCLATCYLHEKKVIHRDIKPDNIMFAKDGHIRLIDFGISCYMWDEERLQEPCGTSYYVAPEVYRTPVRYDKMIDWWAVGVTLLSVIHQADPFTLFVGHLKDTAQNGKGVELAPGWRDFKLGMYTLPMRGFLRRLLAHDPEKRIGAGGESEIRQHRLFALPGFLWADEKWEAMKRGEFRPPLDTDSIPSDVPDLPLWPELHKEDDDDDVQDFVEGYDSNFL